MSGIVLNADLVDISQDLMNRVAQLEQRITSPFYTIPNGGEPTFPSINIGEWRGNGPITPIQQTISSPTGLSATSTTTFDDVAIDASWAAPVDGSAASYELTLAQKDGSGNYTLLNTLTTTGTTAHIGGLAPNITYGITVAGINRIGVVSAPNPVSGYYDITTQNDASVPAAPSGVQATAGATSVMLTWNDNTEPDVARGAGVYDVRYDTDGTFAAPTTVTTSATIASFAGLTSGTAYFFQVRARDASNNPGPWSTTVSATPGTAGGGAAPSDGAPPTATTTPFIVGGVGYLYVRWAAVTNVDAVSYDVHLSTVNGFTPDSTTFATNVTATSVFLHTLAQSMSPLAYDTTYYVKIVAKDMDGVGPAGPQGSGTLSRATTTDIAVGSITAASGIVVSLDAGVITTGYINSARIQAGSIVASQLNVTPGGDNLQTRSRPTSQSNGLNPQGAGSTVTVSDGTTIYFTPGSPCWIITTPASPPSAYFGMTHQDIIPCLPNTVYTASCYVRSPTSTATIQPRITTETAAHVYVGEPSAQVVLSPTWKRVTWTFTTPANVEALQFSTQFPYASIPTTSITYHLYGLQIERADIASEYKPNVAENLPGSINASSITAGTITSDRINATLGLDASLIKFNTMSGDRITANSLDISAIKTSTLSATTITLASTGAIAGGTNPFGSGSSQTGFILNGGAMTTYKAGAITFRLDFSTGNAFFAGDITGSTGTFSGLLTGATYQTSVTPTGDKIVIDSVSGLNLYREATTNYNTQPWFQTVFAKQYYQATPGETGSITSAWGIKYPGNSDWTMSTPATNVSNTALAIPNSTAVGNPIGAPYMLSYTFKSTAPASVAGAYQIYFDVAASAGQSWATSMYMAVTNPTGNSCTGWTQFLDASKNVLLSVQYTGVADGSAATTYTAFAWKRNGAVGTAPAGTAYVRQLIQPANLTSAGSWVGSTFLYGAQIEQKDHHTAYCDGNQYGCTWATGNPNSTSSRPYGTVGHLAVGTATGGNFINGSLFGGPSDRGIAGYFATRDVQNVQAYAFPYGGGVALGNVPQPGQAIVNPSSTISFIPGDGIWQDYGDLPKIYITDNGSIGLDSTQQLGSGNEYPQSLTLYSGYTYYGGINRYAQVSVSAGSGAAGNPYGGSVMISTFGESGGGQGNLVTIVTQNLDVSSAPFAANSPLVLGSVNTSMTTMPAGQVASTGDKIYLWNNNYGIGIQNARLVIFPHATGSVAIQPGPYSSNTTSYRPILASAFTVSSLRSTKEDINPLIEGFGLDKVRRLKPVKFKSKHFKADADISGRPDLAEKVSFVAEDVLPVLPEAISWEFPEQDADGYGFGEPRPVGLDIGAFAPVVVHAIQDLDAQLAALTNRVTQLEKVKK